MDRTNENIPHVRQISLASQALQPLICNQIGWTIEQYSFFQFESGYQFIEGIAARLLKADVKHLKASKLFWGWWRNQWFRRDLDVYDDTVLTESIYSAQNSNLFKSEQLQASFWARFAAMVADGENLIKRKENYMDFKEMLQKVADTLELKPEEILQPCREHRIVEARQILYLLLDANNSETPAEIARRFNQDRTTVIYGQNTAQDRLQYDKPFKTKYQQCKAAINGNAN